VFLAHRRPEEVERVLASPLERLAPETDVDPAHLRERIVRARADGYAWTRDEAAEGISSVAAAVADATGEVVAAVHVHGPTYRFPDPERPSSAANVQAVLLAAAASISATLRRAG
jgi:DNA-binding IclR family transcriptional regulator